MAVRLLGTQTQTTGGSAAVVSPVTADIAERAVVCIMQVGVNGVTSPTVVDSAGNSYTQIGPSYKNPVQNDRLYFFTSRLTSALSADSITVTPPSGVTLAVVATCIDSSKSDDVPVVREGSSSTGTTTYLAPIGSNRYTNTSSIRAVISHGSAARTNTPTSPNVELADIQWATNKSLAVEYVESSAPSGADEGGTFNNTASYIVGSATVRRSTAAQLPWEDPPVNNQPDSFAAPIYSFEAFGPGSGSGSGGSPVPTEGQLWPRGNA
jgi:hypothetical protein